MKKSFKVLTILLIVLAFSFNVAFADNLIVLDKYTGEEVYNNATLQSVINLTSSCSFDRKTRMYIYTTSTSADSEIRSNVYNGMITNEKVEILLGQNVKVSVYRDGEEVSSDDYRSLNEEGHYKVICDEKEVFNFIIVNELTSIVSSYDMPAGFYITSVTKDGKAFKHSDYSVKFDEDGKYNVSYKCSKTGASYTLSVKIDNTAPTLEFIGLSEDNTASGPVKIVRSEENSSIRVVLDGKDIKVLDDTLVDSGEYKVAVYDKAGNSNIYTLKIKLYFNTSSWIVILLVVLIIGAVTGYILYSRKHLRVR